jgi:hypothetical protein
MSREWDLLNYFFSKREKNNESLLSKFNLDSTIQIQRM